MFYFHKVALVCCLRMRKLFFLLTAVQNYKNQMSFSTNVFYESQCTIASAVVTRATLFGCCFRLQ